MARLTEAECRAICEAVGIHPDTPRPRPDYIGDHPSKRTVAWKVLRFLVQRAASESEGTPSPTLSEEEKR